MRDQQYLWKTYHRHADGCEEVLRLRPIGSVAGLTLVFRPDGQRHVSDGWPSVSGDIWIADRAMNLNMPGVARAFTDAAVEVGWVAQARTIGCRNGWDLFDAAYGRKVRGTSAP